MSETYQDKRRELARREFVARCKSRFLLRVPFRVFEDKKGNRHREPVLPSGIRNWGQVADLGDSQLIHLADEMVSPDAAKSLIIKPGDVAWDDTLPPYASSVAGHFSYAHTKLHASDGFADMTGFTNVGLGSYLVSDGTQAVLTYRGETGSDWYFHNLSDMTLIGADYSAEAALTSYSIIVSRFPGLVVRGADVDNMYFTVVDNENSQCVLYSRVAMVETAIGTSAVNYANPATWRLQVVGGQLTVFCGGLVNQDVADASLATAGSAGVAATISNEGLDLGYIDDFASYVEASLFLRSLQGVGL